MHKGHSPTWVPETIHTPFPVSIKSFSRLDPSWLRNTYFVWIWVAPLGNVCGFVIVFPHPRTSLTHAPFYLTDIKSCTPNPCKHGGKCIVQDQSFSCDCAGTGYKGSEYAYFKPTAKYEVHVSDDAVSLFAEGDTCFAADICKQSVFIHYSKQSANELIRLTACQEMKDKGVEIRVGTFGVLESPEIYDVENSEIWNGTHFVKASPFAYNMWLRGDVTWKMQIPGKLNLIHVKGESYIHYKNIDDVSRLYDER